MKLIKILFFISVAVDVKCNELFTFPPKFHAPNTGVMVSSDSSIYLPPESHTNAPYYPMKNFNNMPFPYLPHTGTKASMIMPTPYPIIVSSTLLPMHDNVDDDNDDEKQPTQFQIQKNNRTQRDRLENMERRDLRPKSMSYQPIDRIDMKPSFGFFNNNPSTPPSPPVQKATARSMIISPEQQRNDAIEQFRAAATYQGPHHLPAPNAPGVFISSTTETAVPILRLSNEMDLDGSFSYEALGADQTHYVQHSRVENTGTDKEEQVVEGSYSYVGDNGQTYTVHYVADSNGFRASGDHLPVPPPVPEIIQRAVQFNLAEEAKRPPNQKSWNEEKENEASESERYQQFVMPPTIRPLFTGKTPESFSFGFAQGAHSPPNLLAVASTPNPIRTNSEFPQNQVKSNINNVNNAGPISPQITFLASQGAHLPSGNTQPSIMARVFTTDRSTLPQLVNYEAASKEDTEQHENNKGLWRWQYGLNANVNNQTPKKTSISRSSGISDDVMINFGDMTSDQYSKMLKSQILPSGSNQDNQMPHTNDMMKVYKEPNHKTKVHDAMRPEVKLTVVTTAASSTEAPDWKNNYDPYDSNNSYQPTENTNQRQNEEQSLSFKPKLITQDNFVPQSQMITQSYDYDDIYYEPKRISRSSSTLAPGILPYVSQNNMNKHDYGTQNSLWSNQNQIENIQKMWSTESPAISTPAHRIQFNDFIVNENKNDFKPMLPSHETENQEQYSSTTENIAEDIFESNMFLKNLFKNNVKEQNTVTTPKEEKQIYQTNRQIEHKPDKTPKFIQLQTKPYNDVKMATKKQYDLADIMSFISAKNHFESAKVKPKSKYGANNYNQRSEFRFIPVQEDPMISEGNDDEDENTNMDQKDRNHRTSYYHPEELRGIIKNYKVLQRNNSAFKSRQDAERLKTELSPPPVKILGTNLPPLGRAGPSVKSYLPPIYV